MLSTRSTRPLVLLAATTLRAAQLDQQLGARKTLGEPKVEVREGITAVTFPAAYDAAPINLLVMWNGEGRMAGLLVQPGAATWW